MKIKDKYKKCLNEFIRKNIPCTAFTIERIKYHGPLSEVDAGLTARIKGSDNKTYEAHLWMEHPNNFWSEPHNYLRTILIGDN